MTSYPTKYTDVYGVETTTMTNDGETLRVVLRGLEFTGGDFDHLDAPESATKEQLQQFPLDCRSLCSCRMDIQIPIPIYHHGVLTSGRLLVELILGTPTSTGALDREELRIGLEYDRWRFLGSGKSGWFEDELLDIQRQLPDGVYMKACINCLYSDYSPYGHGLFGCMMCFRNAKAAYLKVKTKQDLFQLHDSPDRMVQEICLCQEFERRIPGTGYRG